MEVKQQSRFQPFHLLFHILAETHGNRLAKCPGRSIGQLVGQWIQHGTARKPSFFSGRSVLNLWKSGKAYLGVFTNLLLNIHP